MDVNNECWKTIHKYPEKNGNCAYYMHVDRLEQEYWRKRGLWKPLYNGP
jgi:hypothetical protein